MSSIKSPRISDESMECIIDMIGYGVTYWAESAEREDWEANPKAILVIRDAESDPQDPDASVIAFTKADLRKAFFAIAHRDQRLVNDTIAGYARSAIRDRDPETGDIDAGYVDSDLGDCIAQVAAFGELVYG